MGCIVSKLFLDFYIFFIFTRPLTRHSNHAKTYESEVEICYATCPRVISLARHMACLTSVIRLTLELDRMGTMSSHFNKQTNNIYAQGLCFQFVIRFTLSS